MVPYILNWLYARYGPEYNLWFSFTIVGFIDYIVSPTLTVIGDSLDLILGTLDIPPNARPASVPENRQQPQSHHSSTASSNSASGNNLLNRPWADILTENRAKWQKKHDAGMLIFNFQFFFLSYLQDYLFQAELRAVLPILTRYSFRIFRLQRI